MKAAVLATLLTLVAPAQSTAFQCIPEPVRRANDQSDVAQPASEKDVIAGCWPLTIGDAESFDSPNFEDYPAANIFDGQPAPVDLTSHPLALRFRTVLRNAAAKGPNFAGRYTISSWGCGSGCVQFAIVDATSGQVFFPPEILHVDMMHVTEPEDASHRQLLRSRFQRDSTLLIVVGRVNEGADEGVAYYRWTGAKLRLVRFIRSEKRACGK